MDSVDRRLITKHVTLKSSSVELFLLREIGVVIECIEIFTEAKNLGTKRVILLRRSRDHVLLVMQSNNGTAHIPE